MLAQFNGTPFHLAGKMDSISFPVFVTVKPLQKKINELHQQMFCSFYKFKKK